MQPGSAFLFEDLPQDCTPVVTLSYTISFQPPPAASAEELPMGDHLSPEVPAVRILEHANMAR